MTALPTDIRRSAALGWQFLQAGNLAAADEVVRPWLSHSGNDELVPLIGAVRLQQGRFSEAAPMFARARALVPGEVRFAFLHGTALAGLQQWQAAVSAFQAAIKLGPNIADIYLSLGQAQRKLGQQQEAQNTYRKLLRFQPENVDGYIALSSALAELGQFADAEAPLRRALLYARDPKTVAGINNNLAIVLSSQSRHAEALESLERTQELAPDLDGLDQRRIDRLYQLGRYEECLSLYRKLLDRDPTDAEMHRAYNSLLYRLGRTDDYLASFDRAPQTREILLAKARMLMMEDRAADAQAIFNELLIRDPLDMTATAGWANSLMQTGRYQEAVAAFETVMNRRGGETDFGGAAAAAMLAGDPQKAEYFCQAGLRRNPYDQSCLALLGTSLRLRDDERDEILNGYDSLIRVFDLDPPNGFSSMESFNQELGAYLASLHPKTDAYLEQSLRGGTQTEGMLFHAGHALVEKLRMRIEEAVHAHIAGLPADESHPFLARRRQSFGYAGSWSSLLRDCGFHVNHLHPEGWISSCYYVTVPDETKDSDTRNGWIKFGEPALDVALKNPVRRAIQPVPGRLVLFPSYMWHGTVPLRAPSPRTTIAFDATPR
jgi:tetratricopeptide (TPR) repeat protein